MSTSTCQLGYMIKFPDLPFNNDTDELIMGSDEMSETLLGGKISRLIASALENLRDRDREYNQQDIGSIKTHALLCVPWSSLTVKADECIMVEIGKNKVTCFFVTEFAKLRSDVHLTDAFFINSLKICGEWKPEGGKSRSIFLKTNDNNFILKGIPRIEFEKIAYLLSNSKYQDHLKDVKESGTQLLLSRFFGLFKIVSKGVEPYNGYIVIMQNTLPGAEPDLKYDIKGSLLGREILEGRKNKSKTLLDGNFISEGFFVDSTSNHDFYRSLARDTKFLSENGIMDYSVLVGVYASETTLICSIIDFLRPYSCDKRVESLFKRLTRCKLPTVISPEVYRTRMLDFVEKNLKVKLSEDINTEI